MSYEILSDVDGTVGMQFGVLFRAPAAYREVLAGYGIDLAERHGNEGGFIPLPATFVVDRARHRPLCLRQYRLHAARRASAIVVALTAAQRFLLSSRPSEEEADAMEMHQIRYFLAVCETRNFTRAAEACNITQPA